MQALGDVARPLSYKTKTTYFFKTKTGQAMTKTTFSRPIPLFLKTIKLLTKDQGCRNKNFQGGTTEKIPKLSKNTEK